MSARMHHPRRPSRWFAAAAVLAGAVAVVGVGPASADQVTPANTAPTVSSPAFTMPGAQTAFEPDAAASDEVYVYGVTVGDAETLNDLDTVVVCLYHSLHEDGVTAGEGDNTCATINAKNTVKLTWTRSTNAFAIDDNSANSYWALGSGADASSAPADLTLTSGSLSFKFTVSEAMREGTWTAKVTATDVSAATAVNSAVTKTVSAYSSITARTQKNFGAALAANTASTATDSPTVSSNGKTTISVTSGNFVNGSYSFTLKTDGATSAGPAAGQVTFDCIVGATFTEASATRIAASATSLGASSGTSTGTAEGGSAVNNTCRLQHGGLRPVGTYSFTVVNTVVNA